MHAHVVLIYVKTHFLALPSAYWIKTVINLTLPHTVIINTFCLSTSLQDLYYIAFGYPEKELNTDIALITGGGNGLGRLLAERLGKMGTKVIIWDINKKGKKRN